MACLIVSLGSALTSSLATILIGHFSLHWLGVQYPTRLHVIATVVTLLSGLATLGRIVDSGKYRWLLQTER
jgi:hypothetical protein